MDKIDIEKEEIELNIEAKYVGRTEKQFLNNITYAECLYILDTKNNYCDEIRDLSLLKLVDIISKLQKENEELEKYKKAYELETYERQKFIDELEIWKKIAEKLASKLNEAYFEQNDFWLFFEKEILKGIEADYGYVGDVIIDWARKEVKEECTSQKKNILSN